MAQVEGTTTAETRKNPKNPNETITSGAEDSTSTVFTDNPSGFITFDGTRTARSFPTVGYPFIQFSVGGVSLTWRSDGTPDFFTSLSHQRFTSQANTAKVNIAFTPKPGEDPNLLETAIVESKGECSYQYGWAGHRSPMYRGLIHNYTVNFNNGSLEYSLEVISEAVVYNFNKIIDSSFDIRKAGVNSSLLYAALCWNIGAEGSIAWKDETENQDIYTSLYEEDLWWRLMFSEDNPLMGITTYEEYEAIKQMSASSAEVLYSMKAIIEGHETADAYIFDVEDSDAGFVSPAQGISVVGQTPVQALNLIASRLVDAEDPSRYFYKIVVNDKVDDSQKGRLTLKRFGSGSGSTRMYVFDWGSKNTDVISWSPKYNGSVAIFRSRGDTESVSQLLSNVNTKTIDGKTKIEFVQAKVPSAIKNGDIGSLALGSSGNIGKSLEDLTEKVNWFVENTNYAYEAELTVIGALERELDLCSSVVEVRPLIAGKLHHTGGLYVVKGITDNVDSNGVTTTFSLYRFVEGNSNASQYLAAVNGVLVPTYEYDPDAAYEHNSEAAEESDSSEGPSSGAGDDVQVGTGRPMPGFKEEMLH